MHYRSSTMEKKKKLLAESKSKEDELCKLESKSWSDLWEADLQEFLDAFEAKV